MRSDKRTAPGGDRRGSGPDGCQDNHHSTADVRQGAEPFQVLPPLTDGEYQALRDDVDAHGVRVPVLVDQHGRILDGHHRAQIAGELGIEYPVNVVEVTDDDHARQIARSLNMARRQLSRQQKRVLVAEEVQADPDRSDRAIGRLLGVDHKTVGSVRRELSGEFPHDDDDDHDGVISETEAEIQAEIQREMWELLTDDQRTDVVSHFAGHVSDIADVGTVESTLALVELTIDIADRIEQDPIAGEPLWQSAATCLAGAERSGREALEHVDLDGAVQLHRAYRTLQQRFALIGMRRQRLAGGAA